MDVGAGGMVSEVTTLLEELWKHSSVGLVLLRADGTCVKANAAACRILGRTEDEMLATPSVAWIPSELAIGSPMPMHDAWQGLVATGTGMATAVGVTRRQVWVDGEVLNLLELTDRTEVAALEEELDQIQQGRLMGRLCGGMVHDLNNLLTVIMAALDKAERNYAGQGMPLILSDGQDAVRRCESLCTQLLTMGQCEPGAIQLIEPDAQIGDMRPLLRRAVPDFVEFSLTCNAGSSKVLLPAGALELIALNVVMGACEALPKGAELRASTASRDGRFCFVLEDNGPGLGEGLMKRAFARRPKTAQLGSAIGLSVAHGLVSRVGGQLDIRSRPERGTTYEVSIEISPDEPKTPSPPGKRAFDASVRGDGKTILLCENDAVLRDVMTGTLSKQGYGVVSCANGKRGLALIEGHARFDALITDLVMPEVGGAAVARACNSEGRRTPVVFISGLLERDALPELDAPTDFISKPFRMNDLLASLQALVAQDER